MNGPRLFRLVSQTARQFAASACLLDAYAGWTVTLRPPRRSDEQSAKMHAMADELSAQVPYMGMKLSREQWKRFATARMKKDTVIFDCDDRGKPSPQAGLLVLGAHTREMSMTEIGEIIAWFDWMGAQHGVTWGDEAKKIAQMERMTR